MSMNNFLWHSICAFKLKTGHSIFEQDNSEGCLSARQLFTHSKTRMVGELLDLGGCRNAFVSRRCLTKAHPRILSAVRRFQQFGGLPSTCYARRNLSTKKNPPIQRPFASHLVAFCFGEAAPTECRPDTCSSYAAKIPPAPSMEPGHPFCPPCAA
ncbi:hypothetical protein TRVL_07623 [Trypanosoma vivax]|nr:hypothetical protein TRVL_07623 [Trypanosoma vivax]